MAPASEPARRGRDGGRWLAGAREPSEMARPVQQWAQRCEQSVRLSNKPIQAASSVRKRRGEERRGALVRAEYKVECNRVEYKSAGNGMNTTTPNPPSSLNHSLAAPPKTRCWTRAHTLTGGDGRRTRRIARVVDRVRRRRRSPPRTPIVRVVVPLGILREAAAGHFPGRLDQARAEKHGRGRHGGGRGRREQLVG